MYWLVLSSSCYWIILICLAMIQNQGKCKLWGLMPGAYQCSARGEMTWGGLTLGELGVGENCGLMKFQQVNDKLFSNFFKLFLLLMSL